MPKRSKNWDSLSEYDQLSGRVDFDKTESGGKYPGKSSRLIQDIVQSIREEGMAVDPSRAWSDDDRLRRSIDPGMIPNRLLRDKKAAVGNYLTGALGGAGAAGLGAVAGTVGPAEAAFQGATGYIYDRAADAGINHITAGDPTVEGSMGETAGVVGALALAAYAIWQARKGNVAGAEKSGVGAVAGVKKIVQRLAQKFTGKAVSAAAAEEAATAAILSGEANAGAAVGTAAAGAAEKTLMGRIFGSTPGQLIGGALGVAGLSALPGQMREMKEAGEDFRSMMPWAGKDYRPTSEIRKDIEAADRRAEIAQKNLEDEIAYRRIEKRENTKAEALRQAQWDTWKFQNLTVPMIQRYHDATAGELVNVSELLMR